MYLPEILAHTREVVAERKATADMRAMERAAAEHHPRGFARALRSKAQTAPAIIAELKKASPSKGLIRAEFPVPELAGELQAGGASALSVLTDEQYFQGSLNNLRLASAATQLPCLRKDFIVDEYQVMEARAHCADAILLIVAALAQQELADLRAAASEWQLDVLCEVHDARELQHALDAGFDMIGVNNRDLHTFHVDLNTSLRLVERIPAEVVKVAESGIESTDDILRLRLAGFDAFLIGESLMRAARPGQALRELLTQDATVRW